MAQPKKKKGKRREKKGKEEGREKEQRKEKERKEKNLSTFINIINSCAFLTGKARLALKLTGPEASRWREGGRLNSKESDSRRQEARGKGRGSAPSRTAARSATRKCESDLFSWW